MGKDMDAKTGVRLSFGAMATVAIILYTIYGIVVVLSFPLEHPMGFDHDGPRDGASGMRIFTDAKTGCQYLRVGDSITPRLDRNGHQICDDR